jgi:uncharacterized DUF497 family protein
MRFEWDASKDLTNRKKHGVSFDKAITAFDDPYALIAPDLKHSTEREVREWLIGKSDSGLMVVVFTIRHPGDVHRIISARRANRRERIGYEEIKRVSI